MIGEMRHRVTLEKVVETIAPGGQRTQSFVAIASVWASVKPVEEPATVVADRVVYPTGHMISTHYAPAYLETRRISLGARRFTVMSVLNEDEANRRLVFRAEEVTP